MAAPVQINKSPADQREYRYLELPNRLKVVLIHDATATKSAASLDLNVGSLSDPPDIPGLAHFCEHMLFLGTKKYPGENDYSKFITSHGGMTNAFTSDDHTNYHFDVSHEHLEGALDHFAQFFLPESPLFNQSCTEREINAVHSEHEKNIPSDVWRRFYLNRLLARPDHPYNHFSTGNSQTLLDDPAEKGMDIRDELLKFHREFYSSNLMCLSILGREPLDELERMVRQRFCDVVDYNVTRPSFPGHPYTEAQGARLIKVVPVKDLQSLSFLFPIDDQTLNYESQPGHYISHLIGHEGPGSLLSHLKGKGWATSLSAGAHGGGVGTYGFFKIDIDLTENGLKNYNDVITALFQYISMLKQEGPKSWIFDELQQLQEISFRFMEKAQPMSYCTRLSKHLQIYPPDRMIDALYLMKEFRPDLIVQVLDCLTPQLVNITLVSKQLEPEVDQVSPWYGTKYSCKPLAPESVEEWSREWVSDGSMHLPLPNAFVPTELDLVPCPADEETLIPQLIMDNEHLKVWHRHDTSFGMPKTVTKFWMFTPLSTADPFRHCLMRLYMDILKDSLVEFSYDAELAGVTYAADNTSCGFELSVSGYSQKLPVVLKTIVARMRALSFDDDKFEVFKDRYKRSLQSHKAKQPHQLAMFNTNYLISQRLFCHAEVLQSIEHVTADDLRAFVPQVLARLSGEALIYGNVTRAGAAEIVRTVTDALHAQPLLPCEMALRREYQLPSGRFGTSFTEVSTLESATTSVEVYFQVGVEELRENVVLMLVSQLVAEPFFDELRTKQQLGYIVHASTRRQNGVQGIRFIVQSDRPPQELDARVEEFIVTMEQQIESMSEADFATHCAALESRLLEKSKTLAHQASTYWGEIVYRLYQFERPTTEVAVLKRLTKDDVLEFYRKYLVAGAPCRRKLSSRVDCSKDVSAASAVGDAVASETGLPSRDPVAEAGAVGSLLETGSVLEQEQERASSPLVVAAAEEAAVVEDAREWQAGLPMWAYPSPQRHVLVTLQAAAKL